ncbi:MAG TPA: outer membrane beta-barrel protein [Steroidobacteraceae bacterium]|nr:outer membrane beta-barrel protein [Steroidobacteraceae bacterium]
MKRHVYGIPAAALLLGTAVAGVAAADTPAKAAAPTLSGMLDAAGVAITGYVDAAYEYQSGAGVFSSGTPDRVFDTRVDSFTLHQASVTVAKQPKDGWGALVNLTAGQDAEVIKSYPVTGGSNFDVTQAFVQYATGPLTLMLGKFVTLSGAEVIAPTGDTNFSRSILFGYAIPFTHTGFRASYAINDQWSLVLGVNNGWDQISDANKQKTLEYGVTYAPIKTFSVTVDGYAGKEPLGFVNNSPTTAQGQRFLVDVVATWNATGKLTFIANYDNGRQKDDTAGAAVTEYKWDGVAGYANYQFTDQWQVSLRGEYFDDKNGYRTGVVDPVSGNGQKWKEATVTLNYTPTANVVVRFEGRYDTSNIHDAFVKSVDASNQPASFADNIDSLAVEALYKF